MSWTDLVGVVAPGVLDRAILTSRALSELRVSHAVIGGLAVGVHGYPRATRDVDFLIGREGADAHHRRGLSAEVDALYEHGVVEFLLAREREPDRSVLQDALARPEVSESRVPMLSSHQAGCSLAGSGPMAGRSAFWTAVPSTMGVRCPGRIASRPTSGVARRSSVTHVEA